MEESRGTRSSSKSGAFHGGMRTLPVLLAYVDFQDAIWPVPSDLSRSFFSSFMTVDLDSPVERFPASPWTDVRDNVTLLLQLVRGILRSSRP